MSTKMIVSMLGGANLRPRKVTQLLAELLEALSLMWATVALTLSPFG